MNLIEKNRSAVYNYFDSTIVPHLDRNSDLGTVDINELERKAKSEMPGYKWVVKKYGNTIRVSSWMDGLNYLYFMVWTPKGLEEYDGWGDVKYHGSRRK